MSRVRQAAKTKYMRKCRNWQTSKTKDLVIIAIVWVQVPSSALNNKTGIKRSVWSLSYCSMTKRALNPWFKVSPPARSARGMRSPGPHSPHLPQGFGCCVAGAHGSKVSAPLRLVQAEVPRTSWTLCTRTVCPNQLEVVSLNSCKNKKTPSHMCEGVFLVVATRFELATSASRTQRSTKLSHATM